MLLKTCLPHQNTSKKNKQKKTCSIYDQNHIYTQKGTEWISPCHPDILVSKCKNGPYFNMYGTKMITTQIRIRMLGEKKLYWATVWAASLFGSQNSKFPISHGEQGEQTQHLKEKKYPLEATRLLLKSDTSPHLDSLSSSGPHLDFWTTVSIKKLQVQPRAIKPINYSVWTWSCMPHHQFHVDANCLGKRKSLFYQ